MWPASRADRRALSLIEVLLYASLLLVVGHIVVGYLVPGLSWQARGQAQAQTVRMAGLALDRLCEDLRRWGPASTSLDGADPNRPILLSGIEQQDVTAEGQPVWSNERALWCADLATGLLSRKLCPADPSGSRLSVVDLRNLVQANSGTEKILCSQITAFSILHSGTSDDAPASPWTVELQMRGPDNLRSRFLARVSGRGAH